MFEVLSESREVVSTYSPIFKFNSSSDPISGDPGRITLQNDRQTIFDMIYPIGSIIYQQMVQIYKIYLAEHG